MSLRRYMATGDSALPRFARWCKRQMRGLSVPAPHLITKPILWVYLGLRNAYYFFLRVFICEPLFKAYCKSYGRRLRTGCFVHWISGKGDIVVGNNVEMDGKISIAFASRFADRPLLQIGDNTGIAHQCTFIVGKRITIGQNCMIAADTRIMDSNGHAVDPAERLSNHAPPEEDVRPVTIGNGVWVGVKCIIFPGVKIGDGSVISAGSVVRSHIPPYSVAAGNPARVMFRLKKPEKNPSKPAT